MRSVVLLLALAAGAAYGAAHGTNEPNAARRAQLVDLVRQDCGACHGMTLKGGLGPSLLPAALAERDAGQLEYVILNGRRGTAMPPWRSLLTEDEARWIADQLKRGFPK